ncbi:hypothetical protein PISMIDRAFT_682396, partial [Pisolithus microcarpus 441]
MSAVNHSQYDEGEKISTKRSKYEGSHPKWKAEKLSNFQLKSSNLDSRALRQKFMHTNTPMED